MAEFQPVDLQKYLTESEAREKKSFSTYPLKPVDKTDKTSKERETGGSVSFVKSIPGVSAVEKNETDTLPRLPWQLERLLSAAASNVLTVELPGVPDVPRYALAWGCAYLTGDRSEALSRLWQVYRAWQSTASS